MAPDFEKHEAGKAGKKLLVLSRSHVKTKLAKTIRSEPKKLVKKATNASAESWLERRKRQRRLSSWSVRVRGQGQGPTVRWNQRRDRQKRPSGCLTVPNSFAAFGHGSHGSHGPHGTHGTHGTHGIHGPHGTHEPHGSHRLSPSPSPFGPVSHVSGLFRTRFVTVRAPGPLTGRETIPNMFRHLFVFVSIRS